MEDAAFGSDKAAFGSNKAAFRLSRLLRSLRQPSGRPCYCLRAALSLPQGGIFSMIPQPGTVSSPIISFSLLFSFNLTIFFCDDGKLRANLGQIWYKSLPRVYLLRLSPVSLDAVGCH